MMVAVRIPCRVPVLVLLAALAAPAARAGDASVAPFPGTSVSGALEDDGGSSAEAPLPALGAEAAGSTAGATAAGAAPEVSSEAAPDAEAGPSDAAVRDGGMAAEKPATPASGSRLLRALTEATTPNRATAVGPADEVAGAGPLHVAEGCPRTLLRRLLAGAAGESDALSALGIEREILTLCRERQEIVAGLFETEARLSELREAVRTPEPETRATAASAVPAPRVEGAGEAPAFARAAPSPLRAALGDAADTRAADTRAAEPQGTLVPGNSPAQGNSLARAPARVSPARASPARASPTQVSPRYAWFSIIGTAGALRAGVSDGTGVWFVREGDALPGGATIAVIAGRPPAVRVTGAGESGEATLLPFRARPGAGP